jgi:hypothetical protein
VGEKEGGGPMSREKWEELVVLADKVEREFIVIPKTPEENVVANAVSKLINHQYGQYAKSVKWADSRIKELEEAVEWAERKMRECATIMDDGTEDYKYIDWEWHKTADELRRRAGKEE